MKRSKFSLTISIALCSIVLLFSCNSGGEQKTDETVVDTTAAMESQPVAKLDKVAFVMHKVADFEKWKPVFEADDSARHANGLENYMLCRGLKDSNMIVMLFKMTDVDKAKGMSTSPQLKEKMEKAGVISKPEFEYIQVVMNDPATITQTNRLLVKHKVKDWTAWKNEFDSHKQARMDAGLIDRGLGYSVDDSTMVTAVFAVTDMQKAEAFTKSKDLKDKMMAAGVEGEPTMLFYDIVKMYE